MNIGYTHRASRAYVDYSLAGVKMNRSSLKAISGFGLVLVFAMCLLSACGSPTSGTLLPSATATPSTAQPLRAVGDASTPIHVELSLSKTPQVGDEVEARLTVSAVRASPNTTATIILPEGVTLVSGQANWRGDLDPNQPVSLNATLRFNTPGDMQIVGHSLRPSDNGDVWGDLAVIYLKVIAPGQPLDSNTPTPPPAEPAY